MSYYNSKGETLHRFLSDSTKIEWGLIKTGDRNNKVGDKAYINTSHIEGELSFNEVYDKIRVDGRTSVVFSESHNHNNNSINPSFADMRHAMELERSIGNVDAYIYSNKMYLPYKWFGSLLGLKVLIK